MDGRIVIALLLGLVVGAGTGWMLKPATETVDSLPSEESGDDRLGSPQIGPELGSDVTVLRAELDDTRTELGNEVARREGAELEIAKLREQVTALRAAATKGTAPDTPVVSKGARYGYDRYKKTLEAIDWDVTGDAIAHIAPLLQELVKARAEGLPMPPSVGSIQRYNGPLVTAALTASQNGVPGTGVNGAFTHPAILANMVYATLLKAGTPLSETQEKRLRELADEFVQEDERRLAGYDESVLALQKLVEEAALKDRFFAAIDGLVTDAQRNVLHPESVRGRTSADLFSSGVLWGPVLAPQRYSTAEELATSLASQLTARFQVPAAQSATVADLCTEWAKGFPTGYLDTPPDTLAQSGHLKVERVRIAAARQVILFRRLLERMPADWAGAESLRQTVFVAAPVRKP